MLNEDGAKEVLSYYKLRNLIEESRLVLLKQENVIKQELQKCEGLCGQSGHSYTLENNNRCEFCGKIKSWGEN